MASIDKSQGSSLQVEHERPPLPFRTAVRDVVRCAWATVGLLARHRIRQPSDHVGDLVSFADGTSARVYRETVVTHRTVREPCALVVEFRLRLVRGRGHAVFRAESLLNTPLFVGFPGFVSKLWLQHDEHGMYRGVYEWDDRTLAHSYARALWRILALVSERGSIHYTVVPGCTRAELVAGGDAQGRDEWWLVTAVSHVA